MALKITGSMPKKPAHVDYQKHLVTKPITALTVQAHKSSKEDWKINPSESETVHAGIFTDGHSIALTGGRTLNLGNYEFARIEVTLTVPCNAQSISESYDFASNFVDGKINEAVKLAKGY
jgi:hypothetical protein